MGVVNAVIAVLSMGMVLTASMISDERRVDRAAKLYSVQSILLSLVFVALGVTGPRYFLIWAASAIVTKAVLVPLFLLRLTKHTRAREDKPVLGGSLTWIADGLSVTVGFIIALKTAPPHLLAPMTTAISLFLIGLVQIMLRRNLGKQVLGLCHFENSSHLTLALMAPNIPETVEIGMGTDAVLLVFFGCLVASRIHGLFKTLDSTSLVELREEVDAE